MAAPSSCEALAATFLTVVLLGCVAQEIQSLLVLGLIPQRAYRGFYHLLVGGTACVLGLIDCAGPGLLHLHAFDKKGLGFAPRWGDPVARLGQGCPGRWRSFVALCGSLL